jgi:hypothetical protein
LLEVVAVMVVILLLLLTVPCRRCQRYSSVAVDLKKGAQERGQRLTTVAEKHRDDVASVRERVRERDRARARESD